jgi:hypothetical protein
VDACAVTGSGGFLDEHWGFFAEVGKQFRQPAYLATSFSRSVAMSFIARSGLPSRVLWVVRIDPVRKCVHVNLVKQSNVPGEEEYLFVSLGLRVCTAGSR